MPLVKSTIHILEDVAWCWWTRPRATRIADEVFLAALDHKGGVITAKYGLTDGAVSRTCLARFEDDDHNNPALLAIPGRPLVCFYSRHDAEEGLRYRISRHALDIGEWHSERILEFGGSTTYAEVHLAGDDIHLFTRVDETRWGWRMSSDWAENWSPERDLLSFDTDQQVYMATSLLRDGRTLRVAVSGHPKDYETKPLHDLWACEVDLETGEVRLPSSRQSIGNLKTGEGLPLDYPALELVSRTPADRTINVLDVSNGPEFEIGFVSKVRTDQATNDARYHVAGLRDGDWQVEDVAPAGRKFGYIHAGFYVGGLAFPDQAKSGQLYLTRENSGLWHFEYWKRQAAHQWQGTALMEPTVTRLARPWPVTNPTAQLAAVALAIDHYPEDSYFGSRSELIGVPLPKKFQS